MKGVVGMTDNKFLMQIVKSRENVVIYPVKPQIANASTKAKLECAAIGLEAAAKICRILAEDERSRNYNNIWTAY